jgi:hypothetical protein
LRYLLVGSSSVLQNSNGRVGDFLFNVAISQLGVRIVELPVLRISPSQCCGIC